MGMLEQRLALRRLRNAKLGEGSFPGHGSAPSVLPPLRVEPAMVLRRLASFSE